MKEVQLKDVCTFINGDRGKNYPSADKISKENIGVPFINAGLLLNNLVDWENMNYISKETFNKLGSGKIQKDDILYCLRGSLGKHAIIDFDGNGAIASSLVILRCNKEIIDPRFLLIQLDMDKIILQQNQANNGSSQPNLSANSVKQYNIKLTDMEEQKEIIYKFNKIAEIIKTRKKQIENLEQLVKSQFVEMFNNVEYESAKLIDIIQKGAGLSYGIVVPGENFMNGIPMIRPSDFNDGRLNLSNIYKVNPDIEEKYKKTRLIGNELLIQVIGQPGQVMLANEKCKGMNVTRNIAVIRPDEEKINRIYLKSFLELPKTQGILLKNTKQSTLKQLPLNLLKELDVKLPKLDKQNQFAEFVKLIDKQKFVIVEIIMFYDIILKSILNNIMG